MLLVVIRALNNIMKITLVLYIYILIITKRPVTESQSQKPIGFCQKHLDFFFLL